MNIIKKIQVTRTKHRIRYLKAVNKAMSQAIIAYKKGLAKTASKDMWKRKDISEYFEERYKPYYPFEPAKPYKIDNPMQARYMIKKQEAELKLQEAKLRGVV